MNRNDEKKIHDGHTSTKVLIQNDLAFIGIELPSERPNRILNFSKFISILLLIIIIIIKVATLCSYIVDPFLFIKILPRI